MLKVEFDQTMEGLGRLQGGGERVRAGIGVRGVVGVNREMRKRKGRQLKES